MKVDGWLFELLMSYGVWRGLCDVWWMRNGGLGIMVAGGTWCVVVCDGLGCWLLVGVDDGGVTCNPPITGHNQPAIITARIHRTQYDVQYTLSKHPTVIAYNTQPTTIQDNRTFIINNIPSHTRISNTHAQ